MFSLLLFSILFSHTVRGHSPEAEVSGLSSAVENQNAQQRKRITGVVRDQNGEEIIGASIMETGTTNGTVTDMDGKFSLNVEERAVIRISYLGHLTQDIKTAGQTDFSITLNENVSELDEVVVVGYGQQKKESLIAAISTPNSAIFYPV
jgi:hypothetical protein